MAQRFSGRSQRMAAQKQRLDIFLQRRCAQAGAAPDVPRHARGLKADCGGSSAGVAGFLLLRLISLAQFAWLPALDAACAIANVPSHGTGASEPPRASACDRSEVVACCKKARVVGGRRARQRRRTNGCLLSAVSASVVIDRHAFEVFDAGSRLGQWRSKCLQASILSLCSKPELREALRRRFVHWCSNNFECH